MPRWWSVQWKFISRWWAWWILQKKKSRLEKELKEAQSHIERLEKLLSGDFANKAPAAVVQKERDKLAAYKDTAEKIKAQLK